MHKVESQNTERTSFSPAISISFEQTQCCRAHNRSNNALIHILDDDSLLNIFSFCRPVVWEKEGVPAPRFLEGGEWTRERWWYKLVHVCQRWRYLILGSASHLGLSLVCAHATPVSDMLENLPHLSHLPLTIDHLDEKRHVTAESREGILLALQHRGRVRRIRLRMSVPDLQKLVMAIDDEFPLLEHLYIMANVRDDTSLTLPGTFQAPHLRHLILESFALPIGSPVLTTAVGLVTLSLNNIPLSSYFHPNDLIHSVSLMPQLETLGVHFSRPPALDIERLPLHMPIVTHVTLPNLRWFGFMGISAYLEAILPRITTPLLEKLQIAFFRQLTPPVLHLSQFMSSTESLRFNSINLTFFREYITLRVYPSDGADMFAYALWLKVHSDQPDRQVASVARILNTLKTPLSTVEYLTLKHDIGFHEDSEAYRTQWRELLRSLGNLKTLRVPNSLVGELSCCLRPDDTEPPMELLPELKVLVYTATNDHSGAFASFIGARKDAGHPVALVRC